jgi:hypothetical protein
MTESNKEFLARLYSKAFLACARTVKYSRVVCDFQVLHRKDFVKDWGVTHSSGCVGGWTKVRKTHKFVGVLTVSYLGKRLHYAASDNDPVCAGSLVIQHVLSKFHGANPDPIYKKLSRFLDKYVDEASKPTTV